MSKRLTEKARSKWAGIPQLLRSRCGTGAAFLDTEDLRALIESEKAGWEEVERLQGQLQDALTVISNALTDVMDMLAVSEMERRNMELCPQCNMLSLHDELQAAIDRIQEGKQMQYGQLAIAEEKGLKDVYVYQLCECDAVAAYSLEEAKAWYKELTGVTDDELYADDDIEIVSHEVKVFESDESSKRITVRELIETHFEGKPFIVFSTVV